MNNVFKKSFLCLVFGACLAFASEAKIHEAQVKQVLHAGSYTYYGIQSGERNYWVVTPRSALPVGAWMRFKEEIAMPSYESKALGQTFEDVIFTSDFQYRTLEDEAKHLAFITEKVATSPFAQEGTLSVQEAQEKRNTLAGKTIQLRAKVVKVSQNIMGRNWVHLQDGTGMGDEVGRIVATSSETPSVGAIVVAKGKVSVDKDFGSGYVYAIILEETVFEEK
ncbi:MAG: hypothetical protein IBX45_01500 [Campylobacterales bacterium]|nr:hypothetical protein [Campylobacterales bacterium]